MNTKRTQLAAVAVGAALLISPNSRPATSGAKAQVLDVTIREWELR